MSSNRFNKLVSRRNIRYSDVIMCALIYWFCCVGRTNIIHFDCEFVMCILTSNIRIIYNLVCALNFTDLMGLEHFCWVTNAIDIRWSFYLQSLYASKVEVQDYKLLCLAAVEVRDQKFTLVGILGTWWTLPHLPYREAFSFVRNRLGSILVKTWAQ